MARSLMRTLKKWIGVALVAAPIFLVLPYGVFNLAQAGTVACNSKGVSVPTKALPATGANFSAYCLPCIVALRTFLREDAADVVVAAYKQLAREQPELEFVYAEMGFPWGGRFPPHRTHREGLSADFHVPLTGGGQIPMTPANRYGYDVDFDTQGVGPAGTIDFDAVALHLRALDKQARAVGGRVGRVFFAPDLQDELFASDAGQGLDALISFNSRQSWVRHDDHYHVDFILPCGVS